MAPGTSFYSLDQPLPKRSNGSFDLSQRRLKIGCLQIEQVSTVTFHYGPTGNGQISANMGLGLPRGAI